MSLFSNVLLSSASKEMIPGVSNLFLIQSPLKGEHITNTCDILCINKTLIIFNYISWDGLFITIMVRVLQNQHTNQKR